MKFHLDEKLRDERNDAWDREHCMGLYRRPPPPKIPKWGDDETNPEDFVKVEYEDTKGSGNNDEIPFEERKMPPKAPPKKPKPPKKSKDPVKDPPKDKPTPKKPPSQPLSELDDESEQEEDLDEEEWEEELIPSNEIKPRGKNSCLKGIRRDVNAYKELKEDKYYDSWIKSVQANARLHGVSLVLDKNYVPIGEDAANEFEDMQTYMWAIVVNTIKTANGKQLICQYDGDAQMGFAKLHQELKESQKAEFSADDLHDKIKALSISK
jgi:hypothetical protein